MLKNKQRGQGLVEFALILPFLLMALLGIIEAARIIWAYTSVQTAAREAARYAVTGKPYITSNPNTYCNRPEGEPSASNPWLCNDEQYVAKRLEAIREVARRRLDTMLVSDTLKECDTTQEILNQAACTDSGGNYGIAIIGQAITETTSITGAKIFTTVERAEYPGDQGLNVQVSIFYNVEMFDPLYDALSDSLMGRPDSYIRVGGELVMQNEGINPSLGNVPPPSIGSNTLITDTTSTGTGPNGERIWSVSGYTIKQNQELTVHLENHQNQGGPYDIFLGDYEICTDKNTSTQHNGDYDCLVSLDIPAGEYDLYSTRDNQYPNRLATAPQKVKVEISATALLVVTDPDTGEQKDRWAANSYIRIQLVAHDSVKQPFNVYFNYGLASQQLLTPSPVNADVTLPDWKVPAVGSLCPVGGTPCTLQSRRASDNSLMATAELFITQPLIVISGGGTEFAQGEIVYILLKGHTPGKKYDLKISNGSYTAFLGTSQTTNAQGDTSTPIVWTVLDTWPNGSYNITSHPAASPPNMTGSTQIATKQITLNTPSGPYITVDGGYTWPINSTITIRVHKHLPANNPYYLKFGSFTVPVSGSSGPDYPFDVGTTTQSAAQNYIIPTVAASGPATNHTIASYRDSNDQLVAQHDFTVTSMPLITVLEGERALPDATITISLTYHVPDSAYQIVYAGVPLVESSGQPFTIQTDGNGQGQRTYSLFDLPASCPAASSANYGIAFPLNSQQTISPNALVATTTLAIDTADLKITQVQLPASANINTNIPLTVTIQNTKPVTIARFFDVDLYADPSPLVPAYKANQFNFPGDVKLWKPPIVAPYGQPGDTFNMTQPFSLTTYGTHTFYGYADTSNFVFNENSEVNNILSNTVTVGCAYPYITDGLSSLSAWTTKIYNTTDTQNQSGYPRISGNRLQMSNDGEGNNGTDDNASNRGYVLLYRTQPITTEPGLDVRVQVFAAPVSANYANAGLEVRVDPANSKSAKIDFGLIRDTSTNPDRHRIQMNYRTASGTTGQQSPFGTLSPSNSNPIWLRLNRQPGSDTFTFYYAQQSAEPTDAQWTVYTTRTIAISSTKVYIGLYNVSWQDWTNGQAEFDNFKFSNTSVCPQEQPETESTIPPGLTICTDPLLNKSFETLSAWVLAGDQGVVTGPGGYTGNRRLLAHSFGSTYYRPYFYQPFQMPAALLANTTLKLSFVYNLNNLDGDEIEDQYYAVVATTPGLTGTMISTPTLILTGDVPPDNVAAAPNTQTGWVEKSVALPLAGGINLADYAGQNLYLYIYNTSNTTTPSCPYPGCNASEFYFDDINLGICTGEPEPATASTKITGDVVLHQLGAAVQKIAGVTVWAYAENGTLYKTFTIQNGKFNFYDLPATASGTKYFIYAEYNITDPNDPTQIDTLAANVTVNLQTTHTLQNPLVTRLDLFPTN